MTEKDDEDRGVPCCAADAARRVTRIHVGPNLIGIVGFDRIMREVRELGPEDEEAARAELLKRVKIYNYVPPKAEEGYADALLREYKNRFKED